MPFVAGCSFCPYTLTVPDRAMGACVRCPKCGNYFTVAPSDTKPAAKPFRAPAQPSRAHIPAAAPTATAPPKPKPPDPDQPWWVTTTPQPVAEPEPEPRIYTPEPLDPKPAELPPAPILTFPEPPPPPEPSSLPPWINLWGVLAFTLAAVAMLLAALSLPRYLSLSLFGLGFLLGLVGVLAPRDEWKIKDAVWLAFGGGICLLLLFLGFTRPDWFNNRWGRDFEVPEPDGNIMMEVSRNNETEIKELSGNDRVDASKHAIRQGGLLIRVESAEIKRPTKKVSPILFVKLNLENVGQLHTIVYRGQAGNEVETVARDSLGKVLPRRDLGGEAKKLGQLKKKTLLPMQTASDLIAVEAPWPGTAHAEIDIPSSNWGREGVCRFTIPSQWIRRE